ncbi:uncharacterized protein J7T54_007350 [Emericellopsis cladophorae]|uniref:Uncharacterized protein n=1 Tax=Emericellopsis cladophorae TaxID=2686198 RepID=A0A9P9Y0J0_9HYPO|nr:uncharacterized protein J7T54_007350 [Emericellopsis cladophorae]KAI6780870.1 hypothetical protein J7T54_007350 [Emericellopsis cladophorae]
MAPQNNTSDDQPPPATNIIDTLPGASSKPSAQPFWGAKMLIWSENVLRLMRMGFHWSPTNIVPGIGDVKLHPPKEITSKHSRLYFAAGKRWICYLIVSARAPPRRSSTLTCTGPHWVNAILSGQTPGPGPASRSTMNESRSKTCFNALYADMLLSGWWPWPKALPVETPSAEKTPDDEGQEPCLYTCAA